MFGQTKGSPDGIVSIPYGKGKDKEVLQMKKKTFVYQSPMGKVKNNRLCCDFIIIHRCRLVKKIFLKMLHFCSLTLVID